MLTSAVSAKDAVTAEKQSNKKSQVKSLAWIRRHVVHDRALSMNAKNVKILFADGVVTLQGPVESDGEKTRVEAIARSYSGTKSVVNELTVLKKTY
jgi:osmotically-inducible protein OsmY